MKKTATQLTRLFACLSTATLIGCGGGAETNTNLEKVDPTVPVSDWVMVWNDEFDGDSIDTGKWTHEVNCQGGGNAEKQCYTDSPDNSFVSDGTLKIVAMPAEDGAPLPYTSARMNTRYKGDFLYGRFEMSAKLPAGQGSWPAFWMLPTDYEYGIWPRSGEIDIVESVNLKAANAEGNPEANIYGTLHYGREFPNNEQSGQPYLLPNGANPADDFHTYAIEWQEGEIRWYVDDYLYATQRRSEVRFNSKDEAVGLAHRGWFTEYYDQFTGELTTFWDNAPFDKRFHLILNFAVGGNWPENVNELGIDPAAFADGNTFEIDYVRVFECAVDPVTGKGCETVRPGYDQFATEENPTGALVEGKAPTPSPPSTGIPTNLTIYGDAPNPQWAAWDCCGGTTPPLVNDDERGDVYSFVVGAEPTVNGFISRPGNVDDPAPFDASPLLELGGTVSFDMKVVSPPNNAAAPWLFKIESDNAASFAEVELTTSVEGVAPAVGVWQTFTFPLADLEAAGLDLTAIDVVMVFPAWTQGEGAEYLLDEVRISAQLTAPELVVFEDGQNLDWPMWNCCGAMTPVEAVDDEEHGIVAEFSVGSDESGETVQGFNTRPDAGGSGSPFDASAILENGVFQFEMKVVSPPNDPTSTWLIKLEADNNTSFAEVPISTSTQGVDPATGEWQTYTFPLADLSAAGLDVSAIDVIMIFPAWTTSAGVVYRVDNVKIFDPDASGGPIGTDFSLFDEQLADDWVLWDCCAGSVPTIEVDDADHGNVAEFAIDPAGNGETVLGLATRSDLGGGDAPVDASAIFAEGVFRFEMKVVTAPSNPDSFWLIKLESGSGQVFAELPITSSNEGMAPVTGEWQTYTFNLSDLSAAGLDVSLIDVVMIFPAWGTGQGAVYRVDNVEIALP